MSAGKRRNPCLSNVEVAKRAGVHPKTAQRARTAIGAP